MHGTVTGISIQRNITPRWAWIGADSKIATGLMMIPVKSERSCLGLAVGMAMGTRRRVGGTYGCMERCRRRTCCCIRA
eukprot:1723853-Pyramimonas_sp.AAC.1